MKKETALSGSVQEKNGKLYAVIGYRLSIRRKKLQMSLLSTRF